MLKINKKVVVIYSGGLDSTVLLTKCKQDFDEVIALNFSYGSKHNWRERQAARRIIEQLNVPYYEYDIPTTCEVKDKSKYICFGLNSIYTEDFLKSNLLKSGGEIPEGNYDDGNMKSIVVPFRNGIMLSLAAGFAESRGFDLIAIANHVGDNFIHLDCRYSFIESIREAIIRGTDGKVFLFSPFTDMTKADIVKLGIELNAPLSLTWSCYKGETRPCLRCGICIERIFAFYLNKQKDPILSDEEWEFAINCIQQTKKF